MLQLRKRALRLLFYCCQILFCLCFGRFQFLLLQRLLPTLFILQLGLHRIELRLQHI